VDEGVLGHLDGEVEEGVGVGGLVDAGDAVAALLELGVVGDVDPAVWGGFFLEEGFVCGWVGWEIHGAIAAVVIAW